MRQLFITAAVACVALLSAAPVGARQEEDQALADAVVAGTADLVPDGWTEEPTTGGFIEVGRPLPECDDLTAAVDKAKKGPFAEIAYGDFAGAAEATVYIFPKSKAAKRFAKTLTSDDALACTEAIGVDFGAEVDTEVEELELNNAAGFRLTLDSQGQVIVNETLRARVGRGVVTVGASSVDAPLPFVEDLITSLEESLKGAL